MLANQLDLTGPEERICGGMISKFLTVWLIIATLITQPSVAQEWRYTGSQPAPIPEEIALPIITNIQAIAAGGWKEYSDGRHVGIGHTVVLKQDGTVFSWGGNLDYQTMVPTGLSGVKAIAAGGSHTVALKLDGTLVSWGRNSNYPVPEPSGLNDVVAISAGGSHTVALRQDGTVVAWGGGFSDFGQTAVPAGLSRVTSIAAGALHTVVLKQDGTIVAWGNNDDGQSEVPAGLTGIVTIAAGGGHTAAVKQDGTVVVWGRNTYGQTTVPANLTNIKSIAAGVDHTVALKQDGTVVAWGRNNDGQTTVPAGLKGVTAIAAAGHHSVALKQDGTVVAWGATFSGQTPVPAGIRGVNKIATRRYNSIALKPDGKVVVWGVTTWGVTNVPFDLSGVIDISMGSAHAVALRQNGTVVAWGNDYYGQSTVPVGLTGVIAIAAGWHHTIALKQNGTVVAWGRNDYGQGAIPDGLTGVVAIAAGTYDNVALKHDGTVIAWGQTGTFSSITNVPAGLSGVTAIAAGEYHAVALKQDGSVTAWGAMSSGPQPPFDLTGVASIAAGYAHSVALKQDGTMVTWGSNQSSQRSIPSGLTGVTAIAAGSDATFYKVASISGPEIQSVGSGAILALDSKQSVTITGTNFHADSKVTLRDHRTGEIFRDRTKISQNSTSIQLSFNFTATPAEWSAEVINPDGRSSGLFRFQVGTTVIPGVTVDQLVITGSASTMDSGDSATLTAYLHYKDGSVSDVTESAAFRIVGVTPEGVNLIGNELRSDGSTSSTTVRISASFQTSSGGIESNTDFVVNINRRFRVEIYHIMNDGDPFTYRASSSINEAGGSYTFTWDFNGDGVFNEGQDQEWATHTYPTMTGEHVVKVRVSNNTTGEVVTAERAFRMQNPLGLNQPLRPAAVSITGIGPIYNKNWEPFQFDYNRIQNGFILLTHGLESSISEPWIRDLAKKIESAIIDTKGSQFLPNIAIYDWRKDANPYKLDLFFGVGIRDLLAITSAGTTNGGYLANWVAAQKNAGFIDSNAPIHFIGHSAGGFVMGQLAKNLNQAGILVDRVTMLDTPMALPNHLRGLPSKGTYVERLVTSYYGSLNYFHVPIDNGDTNLVEYYPGYLRAFSNLSGGDSGHGFSHQRYRQTSTIEHDDYLTSVGVSFRNSPFISGPLNSQRGAFASSLSEPVVASTLKEGLEAPVALQIVDEEIPIEKLTSYGTVERSGDAYTLIEKNAADSGVSSEIVVPLGAYAISFLYQFQDGDESDRLVVSSGDQAVQVVMPNLPLYRTQQFEGSIDVAALGQSTITLDFCLEGMGNANSSVSISEIKFLISDDVDQDGISNAEEVSLGTDPIKRDTDGDGLSDYDEPFVYFTNPTILDTDLDGVADGMEVTDGTDPNSISSTFRITEVTPLDNGDVRLSFLGVDDRTYRVRGSESPFGQTNWTIQSGVRATNGVASVIDTGRLNSSLSFYYWVEVEEQPGSNGTYDSASLYKLGYLNHRNSDSTLSNLTVDAGSISPVFSGSTTSYALVVANSVTSTTVHPTVTNSGAMVKVNGATVASGAASEPIDLAVGSNTITVEVTAEDEATSTIYLVTVTRVKSSGSLGVEQPAGTNLVSVESIVDFGNTSIESSVGRTFTIRNQGTATLSGLALSITGDHAEEFILGAIGSNSLAPGESTEFAINFTPTEIGIRAATIQIISDDEDENPFVIQFSGTGVSADPYDIAFVGTPYDLRVGNQVTFDLNRLHADGETVKVGGKLPSGLKFNSTTGLLTGVITGKPGTYLASIQILQSKTVVRTIDFPITVLEFPATLIGNFNFLMEDVHSVPSGVCKITITGANKWSATLESVGASKKRSAKGSFILAEGTPVAPIIAIFPAIKATSTVPGVPALTVNIPIDGSTPSTTGTYEGGTLRGFRLAKVGEMPPATGPYSLVLDVGDQDGVNVPAGHGWLKGKVSNKGIGTFKGLLGDGTSVSITLGLSAFGQAVLWSQPYKKKSSYIGGIVTMGNLGLTTPGEAPFTDEVWWIKVADPKTLSYPSGFPGMPVTVGTSRWTAPASAIALGSALGWRDSRKAEVTMRGASLSNQETQTTGASLPTEFTLDDKFALGTSQPAGTPLVAWKGKVSKTDGAISGTLTIPAGFSSDVLSGSAAVSGVLLQDDQWGTITGCGQIKVPVTSPKGSFKTAAIVLGQ